tara:strand:- start:47327 stop:47884 length:558 start_codon:yes stop_codon:yes gene_type:complete
MKDKTDDQLVDLIKENNKEAFKELFSRYESILLNYLSRFFYQSEIRDEIFQETILTMISKIHFYEARNDLQNSFKSWLFRIATNKAIDFKRKNKPKEIMLTENFEISLENQFINAEEIKLLREAISQLPKMQSIILTLRVIDNMSLKEISVICSINVNAVKQALYKARKNLMLNFIDIGGEYGAS